MSYRLMIGEACVDVDYKYRTAKMTASPCSFIDAGYNEWLNFCEKAGVYEVFYSKFSWTGPSGEEHVPLLMAYLDAVELNQDHVDFFKKCLDNFDAPCTMWSEWMNWLYYSSKHAVENYEWPTFARS